MQIHDELYNISHKFRGQVIEAIIDMENLIDVYIAEYFAPDEEKQSEFAFTILGLLALKQKIETFGILLRKDSSVHEDERKTLIKNMNCAKNERDAMAHLSVDITEEAIMDYKEHKALTFIRRRPESTQKPKSNKKETYLALRQVYTEDAANKVLRQIHEANAFLQKVLKIETA
jgi:hypothetical protein